MTDSEYKIIIKKAKEGIMNYQNAINNAKEELDAIEKKRLISSFIKPIFKTVVIPVALALTVDTVLYANGASMLGFLPIYLTSLPIVGFIEYNKVSKELKGISHSKEYLENEIKKNEKSLDYRIKYVNGLINARNKNIEGEEIPQEENIYRKSTTKENIKNDYLYTNFNEYYEKYFMNKDNTKEQGPSRILKR